MREALANQDAARRVPSRSYLSLHLLVASRSQTGNAAVRILSANWDRSSMAPTPFALEVVGLRAIHQRASVVRYAEFGEFHCKLHHVVRIEPSLRPPSWPDLARLG
jgi:hypothetical protein